MNLQHLRAFVAVVDASGFARAAARLNLSQPALSRQIHALEDDLGVTLFDRTRRRVQLTSEGEDLIARSRRLLSDATALGERARALTGGETGVLRIGAAPQAIETLLAAFCTSYQRRYPGVDIHLIEEGGANLFARLERGDMHLALIAAGDARFQQRLLAPLYVLAVTAKDHPLGRRGAVEIAELAGLPLLVPRRGFGSRDWFDGACAVGDLRPRVLLESGAPQTLVALARAGYGIAIVPSNTPVPRGGVRAIPLLLAKVPVGRWVTVSWDARRSLPRYAERFVKEFVAHTRRTYPGRDLTRRAPRLPRPTLP
jgi:DNA-binding transcriptional LysR family regulator